jgi:hypothetical protein
MAKRAASASAPRLFPPAESLDELRNRAKHGKPWRGVFYPKDLPQKRELAYASEAFRSPGRNPTTRNASSVIPR